MTNTIDPTLSISNTPKDSPVTVKTFSDVLNLIQAGSLDVEPWVQNLAVKGANRMLKEYGPDWMRKHRVRLIQELELLNEM
ncbi:MAG: hypothetical protein LBP33_02810 [Candidatus Adiutrix sp.]|nr:hypothetical protein [Candidatus Adiutrix sp.]